MAKAKERQPKVFCGTYIPPTWKKQLDDVADERAMSTSALLCSIVRQYLNGASRAASTSSHTSGGVGATTR